MIAFVSGLVVQRGVDHVVVDNQGIGYLVYCGNPLEIPLNQQVLLYTYHHVREDAAILFGFLESQDLDLFKQLINVKGVGPKTGLNILGRVKATELIGAVETENLDFLRTLPGVGAKMASQMMLDLKGKFVSAENIKANNTVLDEVFSALGELGFKRSELNAIKNELINDDEQEVNHLIRKGLQLLHSRKRGAS